MLLLLLLNIILLITLCKILILNDKDIFNFIRRILVVGKAGSGSRIDSLRILLFWIQIIVASDLFCDLVKQLSIRL